MCDVGAQVLTRVYIYIYIYIYIIYIYIYIYLFFFGGGGGGGFMRLDLRRRNPAATVRQVSRFRISLCGSRLKLNKP